MPNQKIISLLGVIKKPNYTFKEINENGETYFKFAILVLVVSLFFGMSLNSPENVSDLPANDFGIIIDIETEIVSSTFNILTGFTSIILIYYIGKKLGGGNNFRSVFSVLSYSFVPVFIGGVISAIVLYNPPFFKFVFGMNFEDPFFQSMFWVMYFGIFLPCMIWSFILQIKAVKIANYFSTKKSLGIIFLVALINIIIFSPITYLNVFNHPYFGSG